MSEIVLNNGGDYLKLKHEFDSSLAEIDKEKTFTFALPTGISEDRNN